MKTLSRKGRCCTVNKSNKNLELAREWFAKAKADIDFAKIGFKQTKHYGQVCFLCQQAVEKYLKGFLVASGIKPKKIHATATLARQCSNIDIQFEAFINNCKILDRYYIPPRYPVGPALTYREKEAQMAINIMEEIIDLIEGILNI